MGNVVQSGKPWCKRSVLSALIKSYWGLCFRIILLERDLVIYDMIMMFGHLKCDYEMWSNGLFWLFRPVEVQISGILMNWWLWQMWCSEWQWISEWVPEEFAWWSPQFSDHISCHLLRSLFILRKKELKFWLHKLCLSLCDKLNLCVGFNSDLIVENGWRTRWRSFITRLCVTSRMSTRWRYIPANWVIMSQ